MLNKIYQIIANFLPKPLIYWCFVKGCAMVTCQEYSNTNPTDLNIMQALERLDKKCLKTSKNSTLGKIR